MKKIFFTALFAILFANPAHATPLKVTLGGIEDGKAIPEKNAYCTGQSDSQAANGQNTSPVISWEKGPDGTKSYAVIVVDRDVPTNFNDANKKDKTISESLPRQNFYHWILVNIPANITSIPENAGKDKNYGDQLTNDFLRFSGVPKNSQNIKKFSGYDGPCPPWNDERMHNYHFKVYALSQTFTPGEDYKGDDIIRTITPYILAEGEVVGSYTLNEKLKNPPAAVVNEPAKTK